MLALLVLMLTTTVLGPIVVRTFGAISYQAFAFALLAIGIAVRSLVLHIDIDQFLLGGTLVTADDLEFADAVGSACMLVYVVVILSLKRGRLTSIPEKAVQIATKYRALLLFCFALLVFLAQIALSLNFSAGSLSSLEVLSQRTIVSGSAIVLAMNLSPIVLALVIANILISFRSASQLHVIAAWLVLFLSLGWLALLSGRATAAIALWSLILVMRYIGGARISTFHVGLAAILVAFVTIGGLALRKASQQNIDITASIGLSLGGTLNSLSEALPTVDHFLVGIMYQKRYGYDLGAHMLDSLVIIIPRELWSDKPMLMPQKIGIALTRYDKSGLPAGVLGEGYISGGIIGTLLATVILGFCAHIAQAILGRIRNYNIIVASWAIVVMSSILAEYIRVGPQGALSASVIDFALFPIVILVAQITTKSSLGRRLNPIARISPDGTPSA